MSWTMFQRNSYCWRWPYMWLGLRGKFTLYVFGGCMSLDVNHLAHINHYTEVV